MDGSLGPTSVVHPFGLAWGMVGRGMAELQVVGIGDTLGLVCPVDSTVSAGSC